MPPSHPTHMPPSHPTPMPPSHLTPMPPSHLTPMPPSHPTPMPPSHPTLLMCITLFYNPSPHFKKKKTALTISLVSNLTHTRALALNVP
jgi:hypothetical protein